jgi:hypothetical protein
MDESMKVAGEGSTTVAVPRPRAVESPPKIRCGAQIMLAGNGHYG